MNSWAFLSQHCDRSAPALRLACKGWLHQNALWLLIGSRRRKVALNAALWWYKVRSSAPCAPPVCACVQQGRAATQLGFLWFGRAMPLGVGSEPAIHARPALPYWANNVGMRGSVCPGILSQPPTGTAAVFSPAGASQRRVFSDRSKAQRAATRRVVIPTVLGRTGSCGRVIGPDERRIYLVLFLKRGSGACSSNISAAGRWRCHTRQVPGPACLLQLWRFCLGTCLSH